MTDTISIDELLAEGRAFLDATVPALNAADEEYRFKIEGHAEVLAASDNRSGPDHSVGPRGWAILQPAG